MKLELEQLESRDCPSADVMDHTMAVYQVAANNITKAGQICVSSTIPVFGTAISQGSIMDTPVLRGVRGKCMNVLRLVDQANTQIAMAEQALARYSAAEDELSRTMARRDFISHINQASVLMDKAIQILVSAKRGIR